MKQQLKQLLVTIDTTSRVYVSWSVWAVSGDCLLVPEIRTSTTHSAARTGTLLRLKTATVWAANCHVEAQRK